VVVKIADFGCGDMQFANNLLHEIRKREDLVNVMFKIHAFDIAANVIPISDDLKDFQQIEIVVHPGVK